LGKMCLAYPGRSVEQDMFPLFDKGAVSQVANQAGVEFGSRGEVKPFQGLFFFEGGLGKP